MKRDLTIKEYQKVLDNIADGVFVIDPNGIVLVANKAVELNGGKKVEEILGRNIVELENEGYCTEFVSKRVIKSKKPETALQRTKDNRELLVTGNPCFDENGAKIGDAVDNISSLGKNEKWEFRAVLNSGDVKSCKVKDAYVSAE